MTMKVRATALPFDAAKANPGRILDVEIAHVDVSDSFAVADFDVASTSDIRKGVLLARREVLRDAARKGFNALVEEGYAYVHITQALHRADKFRSWQLTLLRKDGRHRVIVQYTGRPGRLYGDVPVHPPPFIDLLRQVSVT